jgi:hypothetical protein
MGDHAHQEQDQEDEKEKFRNACGRKSNGPKAKQPRDDRDDEKNQRIIKHVVSISGAINPASDLYPTKISPKDEIEGVHQGRLNRAFLALPVPRDL